MIGEHSLTKLYYQALQRPLILWFWEENEIHLHIFVIMPYIDFGATFPILVCSCGSCGYPLNLASSNRITSGIGSEYKKSIKKGFISFLSVDLSRFTQVDEVNCLPFSWIHYSKTKLLCRKCGVLIGYGYKDSSALCGFDSPTSSNSDYKKFMIKIRALQPSEEC